MDAPSELNLRIVQALARYLEEQHGAQALARAASAASVRPEVLDGRSHWVSMEQLLAVLGVARELAGSDEAFKDACRYRMREIQGPARFLIGAVSPARCYELCARFAHLVSTVGVFGCERLGPGRLRFTYRSEKPEPGVLLCISRLAMIEEAPTLWGLPRAHVEHPRCMGHGDELCEYVVHLYESRRWVPALLGLMLGAAFAWVARSVGFVELPTAVALPVLGVLSGALLELGRAHRANLQVGRNINEAYLQMAADDAAARRELAALEGRQREWSRLMEEQLEKRADALQQVATQLKRLQRDREQALRGVSHDLRNPLAVLRSAASWIEEHVPDAARDGEWRATLSDVEESVRQMDRLLEQLMASAQASTGLMKLSPARLVVATLIDQLRGRLRALVYGRPIRFSVFGTREAPEAVVVDPLLFDRILDNLLTNAAKYTDRGSVVVELDGRPGSLVIKVSDTGRGMTEAEIDGIFRFGEAVRSPGPPERGYGIGLSVVVRLLDQIGGRLEVMSKPGVGTTFWACFPEQAAPDRSGEHEPAISEDRPRADASLTAEVVRRVVRIRRPVGGAS
jgi:signal transduction histidine kinase